VVLDTTDLEEHSLEHLDLSGTTLGEFPVELLLLLPQLRALQLSRCNIMKLKSNLYCRMNELRNLNLEQNNISDFNCFHFVIMFPVLQVLNLTGNALTRITLTDCEVDEMELSVTQLGCFWVIYFTQTFYKTSKI